MGMKKTKQKSNKTKKAIKRTTQSTIPFIEGYQNGIMQIDTCTFSKTMELSDISFKTASEEEQEIIISSYEKLLNGLTEGEDLFFTFVNYRENGTSSLNKILPQIKGDAYDDYRNELATMIKNKVINDRNNIKTKKYATIKLNADSVDEAIKKINDSESNFQSLYKKITHQSSKSLDLSERLHLLHFILNGDKPNPWFDSYGQVDFKALKKRHLSIKDIIAPEYMKINGKNIEIDDRFCRAYYLDHWANWMNTDFLSKITETNFESCMTVHIEPIPQSVALKAIHNRSVNMMAEIIDKQKHSEVGYIPKELQDAQANVEELQDDLMNRDQRAFYMSLVMMVFADSEEELETIDKTIKSIANNTLTRIQPLIGQMERGFVSALPLGHDKTYTKRFLTTESMALFIPFDEVNVLDEGGFYYGVNSINKSLIVYNRLKGQNYNGLILGSSGSGKSFAGKREMANTFLTTTDDICIIDPDGEYGIFAEKFEGSVIKISPGNGVYINPLDLDIDISFDSDSNPLTMKVDFICGMLETMLGSTAKLSPAQKTIVDRCVKQIYTPYLKHLSELPPQANGKPVTIDKDYCPTLQNLFDALLSQPQAEAQNLALVLETYATGTYDTFSHRTNVDLNNRVIVYDIKEIGTNLKELALKVCLNDIWNRIMANRRKNKWTRFWVDEFHLLMTNDSTSEFLKTIWKRARKFQGVPTGITQNVEDLLQSSEARAIINNTNFVYMMNQSKMDREMLAEILGLSGNEVDAITNADIGCGLLYTGKQAIPFIDNFPQNTELYKIMSTKPKED